jgi:hypothetical protein
VIEREDFTISLLDMIKDQWGDGYYPVVLMSDLDGECVGVVTPFKSKRDLLRLLNTCRRRVMAGEIPEKKVGK